jgi:hypothetical protein
MIGVLAWMDYLLKMRNLKREGCGYYIGWNQILTSLG